MHWRTITLVMLVGMVLGGITTLVIHASSPQEDQAPASLPHNAAPPLVFDEVDAPPEDPSLDTAAPAPPDALPPLSAEAPPVSAPVGSLPPLPTGGDVGFIPNPGSGPVSNPPALEDQTSSTEAVSLEPITPPQRLSPPKGHSKIERSIRQIRGVSSLAWGGGKTLHVLVRGASTSSVAAAACTRANAVAKGVRVDVQSVSDPSMRPSQRDC